MITTENSLHSLNLTDWLKAERLAEVDQWIAKYPEEERQSAVMRTLMLAQEEHGYLSEPLMNAVACYLKMPPIAVYEVATFYSMYRLKPAGKHTIGVCRSFSCQLRGSDKVLKGLCDKLNISIGGTTEDKQFTVREVECLGACVGGPVAQIGTEYHENLTCENLDAVLDKYRSQE